MKKRNEITQADINWANYCGKTVEEMYFQEPKAKAKPSDDQYAEFFGFVAFVVVAAITMAALV